MIRHYITIASRNFIKYKLQTLISVIGLAIGLVCFTYGMKWLEYETSYDGFYPKSKQMHTLYGINKQTGKKERKLPLVLARKLKQDFPEIKETALVYGNFGSTFKYNDQILEDPEEIFIDNNFFTLFPRKVLSGRQTNLLHSLDEIRLWIENRNRSIHVSISPVPFSSLEHWSQDEDGTLRHSSGRFF